MCKSCRGDCNFGVYRESVVKSISFFLTGIDQRNSTFLDAIQNPKNSSMFNPVIEINASHDLGGFDVLKTGPFCIHA